MRKNMDIKFSLLYVNWFTCHLIIKIIIDFFIESSRQGLIHILYNLINHFYWPK